MKVLLVDDDADIRAVARMALEIVGGMQVQTAATAEEALETAGAFAPDVILLDLVMPGTTGPSLLDALRKVPGVEKTPVMFITAWDDPGEHAKLRERGAADVISKPFDPMALAERIRTIIPSGDAG